VTGPVRDALQIDEQQARNAADFFESYANTVLRRSVDSTEAERMDAASSLREAGQWALLFDPHRARELLKRSGGLWLELGYPFGAFLMAAFATERNDRSAAAPFVDDLMRNLPQGRRPTDDRQPHLLLTYPHQQAYLLLAIAAMPGRINQLGALIDRAASSPHRNGVAPIGALGTPIRMHWRMATALLQARVRQNREDVAADVSGSLADIAEIYGRTIDSAMANRYLWSAGGAPVEVADLDVVGVISVAATQLGPLVLRQHLDLAKERLTNAHSHIILDIGEYMIDDPPDPSELRLNQM
jgi:hypothetical protein